MAEQPPNIPYARIVGGQLLTKDDAMKVAARIMALAIVGVSSGLAATVTAASAVSNQNDSMFTVEEIARGELDNPDRTASVQKITLPPGGSVDWHSHPGEAIGIVTGGGELTIVTRSCGQLVYPTGSAFRAPRSVHTARNFSESPLTIVASFEVRGDVTTVFVDEGTDGRLDSRCDLDQ